MYTIRSIPYPKDGNNLNIVQLNESTIIANNNDNTKWRIILEVFKKCISFLAGFYWLPITFRRFSSVAKCGTNYFLLKIEILAKCERELTTKFAIARNGCYMLASYSHW